MRRSLQLFFVRGLRGSQGADVGTTAQENAFFKAIKLVKESRGEVIAIQDDLGGSFFTLGRPWYDNGTVLPS